MACGNSIGYPIMLKASWGGGGKGIRKCSNDEEVTAAFKQASVSSTLSHCWPLQLAGSLSATIWLGIKE